MVNEVREADLPNGGLSRLNDSWAGCAAKGTGARTRRGPLKPQVIPFKGPLVDIPER